LDFEDEAFFQGYFYERRFVVFPWVFTFGDFLVACFFGVRYLNFHNFNLFPEGSCSHFPFLFFGHDLGRRERLKI